MADYYITTVSRYSPERTVHRSDCSRLPPASDCLYLGHYGSNRHAYEVARSIHEEVDVCGSCLPDVVAQLRSSARSGNG